MTRFITVGMGEINQKQGCITINSVGIYGEQAVSVINNKKNTSKQKQKKMCEMED